MKHHTLSVAGASIFDDSSLLVGFRRLEVHFTLIVSLYVRSTAYNRYERYFSS